MPFYSAGRVDSPDFRRIGDGFTLGLIWSDQLTAQRGAAWGGILNEGCFDLEVTHLISLPRIRKYEHVFELRIYAPLEVEVWSGGPCTRWRVFLGCSRDHGPRV